MSENKNELSGHPNSSKMPKLNHKLCNYYAFAEVTECFYKREDFHDCANEYFEIYKKCLEKQKQNIKKT